MDTCDTKKPVFAECTSAWARPGARGLAESSLCREGRGVTPGSAGSVDCLVPGGVASNTRW